MYLNLFHHHLMYISDFDSYAKKFLCKTCHRHFNNITNAKRHQRTCKGRTKRRFPGGFYSSPQTIFDRLEQYSIVIPESQRFYEWFLVYDLESMLVPLNTQDTSNLQYTESHVPISVSICSNVPGHTDPLCIVDPDVDALVRKILEHMTIIADKAAELTKEKFADIFEILEESVICDGILDGMSIEDDYVEAMIEEEARQKSKLKTELVNYCEEMICIGFNSAKYDINLIKNHLIKHLGLDASADCFVVKRNNVYTCIRADKFKFLDITQYLGPGINYSGFLRAFDVQEAKGYFPYQFLDSVEKLDYPRLPPHEAFYSTLKDSNITCEEYAFCQSVWQEKRMETLRDFLEWYNNLDVQPFVKAVQNLQKYYFERRIDIFKCSISVPGLARQMLFDSGRKEGSSFALIDEANKDLYDTIKQNIIGGPSIIFKRHHEVGKTRIRGNPRKPCGKIIGFDANALYLHCIGKEMPVGSFVRRLVVDGFKPRKRDRYTLAFDWLEWLNRGGQYKIVHKLNSGKEKTIGRFPVDGYDESTNTVFQFHGCYWHGHRCWLTRHVTDDNVMKKREEKTRKITQYLRLKGHKVVEMRECTFRNNIRFNTKLNQFVQSRTSSFNRGRMSARDVIAAVMNGKLFGMVECDIRVPESWPSHFNHPSMTPYEYFSEMSPLFCTTDIPFDVIGSHMQNHVKRFNLCTKPRRLLVGGMRARQLLIATPLLRWYISHGLEISKIYQTVEYTPQKCFQNFVRDVSNARRKGDVDPSKSILADTRKLEGNSAFGSTIMDQEKFQTLNYVRGEGRAMRKINEPCFRKLTPLFEEEELYEIESYKKVLNLNLPIQIGYFILQYAKLHMLRFYYDFMDRFVDRADFEYCEMDTDSAYMAISGSTFESVIKKDMLSTYNHGLKGYCIAGLEIEADCDRHWFPRTCCVEHSNYDRRTPGLFKIEYEGDEIIGLCSKTYIVSSREKVSHSNSVIVARRLVNVAKKFKPLRRQRYKPRIVNKIKFSCKGISKKRVKCPLSTFRSVLKTQKKCSGENMGFKVRNNGVCTYRQMRNGFTYFYCKRKVLSDGVSTQPLDIELCPVKPPKDHETEIDDLDLQLIHLLAQDE